MQILNLPPADFRTRSNNGRDEIFDPVRKRFVALTPEEWVRQNFLQYLINVKNIPPSLIGVEVALIYNNLKKRGDIVVWNNTGKPKLIVECKATEVMLTQDVFHQVAMYNMALNVDYLIVTNGLVHYACSIDHERQEYHFLEEIPGYEQMKDITGI
ncbi:MAG TPA: type I restriction enzyme HsdR N-terminal domain-containing protein [Bacteroidales bacterium]|nr:type I restriction enzyme HsdR N-terminal domain-containing protein [Bacteroidales bacterium]